MANLGSLDLKLVLSFANAYRRLNEKGEISDQQLKEVMKLVENYQSYSPKEFKDRLQGIFPESDF
jgi:mRNA-degrading endonuclease YafQ of YafQ-DinJ toxin-antitoxin module